MSEEWKDKFEEGISKSGDYDFNPDFKLRVSAAGDCPRLLDYKLQCGSKAASRSQALRMFKGSMLGKTIADKWYHISKGNCTDFEEEVIVHLDNDIDIKGHIDGFFKAENLVWELKSVSKETFEMVEKLQAPIEAHLEQGNLYADAKLAKGTLYQYYNSNNGQSIFFEIEYDKELADQTKDKLLQSLDNEMTKTIGDRPYVDPTESPCWFCPNKPECYEDYKDEFVSKMDAEFTPDDEGDSFEVLIDECDIAQESRTLRLHHEKKEESAKQSIAEKLLKSDFKSARLKSNSRNVRIFVKLGKNNNPLISIKESK